MKLTKKQQQQQQQQQQKELINENKPDPRIGLGVWFEQEMY